jgi:hypothetical protein|tara:strand:- start:1800 stop:2141 length:342 start_codon:yes stop_codon:yes gene_type:complete
MSLEQAISMEPVGEKLRNLNEYLPGVDKIVYDFAAYFADRLGERELRPQGFNMEAKLTLADLQAGKNRWTGEPVPSDLVGHPLGVYVNLEMYIPMIAEAACPPDFAQKVKEIY